MSAEQLLKASYPPELIDALLNAYREIESNYSVRRWKASELDAGHLVEAARRMLDHALFGSYTPIGKSLANFSDSELKRYEQASGDESHRLLIPRVLKSIFNLRNKRGVGHLGVVSPNEMDATLILYSSKWVLGEFVRLAQGATVSPDIAQRTVDQIMERRLDLIWKSGDRTRILDSKLSAREQVLILLYDQNLQTEDALRDAVEYRKASHFRQILKRLHADRLIEFSAASPIAITSKGVIEAESLILKASDTSQGVKAKKTNKRTVRRRKK